MEYDLTLTQNKKELINQWKFEPLGKVIYVIRNRKNNEMVLEANLSAHSVVLSNYTSKLWKIKTTYLGFLKISNGQFPNKILVICGSMTTKIIWFYWMRHKAHLRDRIYRSM